MGSIFGAGVQHLRQLVLVEIIVRVGVETFVHTNMVHRQTE